MKKSIILIMSLLCALAHISAQDTYTARVVDATTGDALPMASVYISSSHSTITNQEGDFSIKAHPEDMLHITYVGYNGKNIKASDLGRKVALKPYTRLLKEVIVTPIDIEGLLKKLTKKLNDEYNKFRGIQSNYFFRQVTQTTPPTTSSSRLSSAPGRISPCANSCSPRGAMATSRVATR